MTQELNENYINRHNEVLSSLLLSIMKLFLDWIVSDDEKWILYNNRRCSEQWLNNS